MAKGRKNKEHRRQVRALKLKKKRVIRKAKVDAGTARRTPPQHRPHRQQAVLNLSEDLHKNVAGKMFDGLIDEMVDGLAEKAAEDVKTEERTHNYVATLTRDKLRKLAAVLKIPGRGSMLKPELVEAVAKGVIAQGMSILPIEVSE